MLRHLVVLLVMLLSTAAFAENLENQTLVLHADDPVSVNLRGEVSVAKQFGDYVVRASFRDQQSLDDFLAHGPVAIPLARTLVFRMSADGKPELLSENLEGDLTQTDTTFCGNIVAKGFALVSGKSVVLGFERTGVAGNSNAVMSYGCSYWNCSGSCTRCVNCQSTQTGCNSSTTCTERSGTCQRIEGPCRILLSCVCGGPNWPFPDDIFKTQKERVEMLIGENCPAAEKDNR